MKTIGVLACKMLQDEIIYLIQNDPKIQNIVLIENDEHTEFAEKLDKLNMTYQSVPSIEALPDMDKLNTAYQSVPSIEVLPDVNTIDNSNDSFSLIVWNVQLGLHEFPKRLKEEIYIYAKMFAKKVHGVYLLYGLCGNVLGKIEEDFESICPLVILRDGDGEIVDDCIGATIGGRRSYLNLLKSFKGVGTLIFTPMYSATVEEFFEHSRQRHMFTEEQIIEMNKYMFNASNYKRVAILETGLHFNENTEEKTKIFADKYELEIIRLGGGNQEIFWNCYEKLKTMI